MIALLKDSLTKNGRRPAPLNGPFQWTGTPVPRGARQQGCSPTSVPASNAFRRECRASRWTTPSVSGGAAQRDRPAEKINPRLPRSHPWVVPRVDVSLRGKGGAKHCPEGDREAYLREISEMPC